MGYSSEWEFRYERMLRHARKTDSASFSLNRFEEIPDQDLYEMFDELV